MHRIASAEVQVAQPSRCVGRDPIPRRGSRGRASARSSPSAIADPVVRPRIRQRVISPAGLRGRGSVSPRESVRPLRGLAAGDAARRAGGRRGRVWRHGLPERCRSDDSPSAYRQSKRNGVSGISARSRSTSSLRPNRCIVTWKGCGEWSGLSAMTSPSTIRSCNIELAHRLDDFGNGGGDVAQISREHAYVEAALVCLDPGAVQFPLERDVVLQLIERLVHIRRRLGEHRLNGLEQPHAETRQARLAVHQRLASHRCQRRRPSSSRAARRPR